MDKIGIFHQDLLSHPQDVEYVEYKDGNQAQNMVDPHLQLCNQQETGTLLKSV